MIMRRPLDMTTVRQELLIQCQRQLVGESERQRQFRTKKKVKGRPTDDIDELVVSLRFGESPDIQHGTVSDDKAVKETGNSRE
jgi:hypothetical protein